MTFPLSAEVLQPDHCKSATTMSRDTQEKSSSLKYFEDVNACAILRTLAPGDSNAHKAGLDLACILLRTHRNRELSGLIRKLVPLFAVERSFNGILVGERGVFKAGFNPAHLICAIEVHRERLRIGV